MRAAVLMERSVWFFEKDRFVETWHKQYPLLHGNLYMTQVTKDFHLQAATPFEQKVFHWLIGWLWEKALARHQRTKPVLGLKTGYRLVQLSFLLLSTMLMYISFLLWKHLVPYIQIIVNDPIRGLEYVPPTYQHLLGIFVRWISLVISIYAIVLAIIFIRLRNMSFLFRFIAFCCLGGMPCLSSGLWDFGMPAFMLIGGRTFFLVLMSMASFAWLLSVFYVKELMEEEWKRMGILPNANEVDE